MLGPRSDWSNTIEHLSSNPDIRGVSSQLQDGMFNQYMLMQLTLFFIISLASVVRHPQWAWFHYTLNAIVSGRKWLCCLSCLGVVGALAHR